METAATKFRAFLLSVGVHLLCVLLLVAGLTWTHTARPLSVPGPVIEATLANFTPPARSRPPKPAPKPVRPAPAPKPELQPPPEPVPPPRAEDQIDREEIDRMATEQAEQEQIEQEEMRKREQELLEAERDEQLADIRRLREEAEAERIREEKKLAMIEEREQQQRDLEEQALERERMEDLLEQESEQRAGNEGVDEDLLSRYVFSLQQIVTINWLRPDTTQPGLACTVRIVQIPGGEVLSANVVAPCNGDDLTRRSLEAAVLRAQPLPYQGYESVFQRSIDFVFRYDG